LDYRQALFRAGFWGAYSFPIAAPIAQVSRPLEREVLKRIAMSVRQGTDGKIRTGAGGLVSGGGLTLFGPVLDLPLPALPSDAVLYRFPSLVLCAALVKGPVPLITQEPPSLCFRAAMLANLLLRPLPAPCGTYSFEWKIGVPVWLPKEALDTLRQ
jgi:hypothetical protein